MRRPWGAAELAAVNVVGYVGAGNHRRFQCLVAACLLALAVWVLLSSLERTAIRAEQQGLKLMLNQLRSALVVKGAEIMLTPDQRLEQWAGINPVTLLQETPRNWNGPCSGSGSKPGTWCFAGASGLLMYQPRWLGTVPEGEPLKWRVDTEFSGSREAGNHRAVGLSLNRVKSGQKNPMDHGEKG